MAHQCLKCGNSYPDGSPQILRGCESCKGTRFFYTEAPIGASERERMAAVADKDLESLALGKGIEAPPRTIPTKGELPVRSDADWVKLGPGYLRNIVEDVVRRSQAKKPVFRTGIEPPKTVSQWVREQAPSAEAATPTVEGHESIEIVDLFGPEPTPAPRDTSPAAPPSRVERPDAPTARSPEELVYRRAATATRVPAPLALDGAEAAADEALKAEARRRLDEAKKALEALPVPPRDPGEKTLYPEGVPPETVAIKGDGQYELDVKRLLEKSPIVVHRDGTYSLHLPSLMESVAKGRR